MTRRGSSHGLWERTAPPAPQLRPLRAAIDVDVAVVGAGYTGLSAAVHLVEGGASTAVLEAAEIGFGGSGRNVGLVNAGMWVMPEDLPAALGEIYGERLLALLGDAPRAVFDLVEKHKIACELERRGTLHCAVGRRGLAELKERARQWQSRGAPVRLLDSDETAAKVGTSAYAGSLLDERAGTIQPLAYARGLAGVALELGAHVYISSPVIECKEDGVAWTLRTPEGSVRADWVIVATNAYSSGPWADIRDELVRLPYFNFATKPLSDNLRRSILPERQGAWDTRKILSSFRFDQQGRLVFGSVGALRGAGTTIHRDWARRALRKLFPQLGLVEFETEWFGMIGMTEDSLPKFHKFGRNIVSLSGYNGRGIAPGTVFGRCLAQLALGAIDETDLPLPLRDPAPAKHRVASEALYEIGAQLVHLAGARI
jgi:glycine/D-amino acid oxidase-like deaminating enzyme